MIVEWKVRATVDGLAGQCCNQKMHKEWGEILSTHIFFFGNKIAQIQMNISRNDSGMEGKGYSCQLPGQWLVVQPIKAQRMERDPQYPYFLFLATIYPQKQIWMNISRNGSGMEGKGYSCWAGCLVKANKCIESYHSTHTVAFVGNIKTHREIFSNLEKYLEECASYVPQLLGCLVEANKCIENYHSTHTVSFVGNFRTCREILSNMDKYLQKCAR